MAGLSCASFASLLMGLPMPSSKPADNWRLASVQPPPAMTAAQSQRLQSIIDGLDVPGVNGQQIIEAFECARLKYAEARRLKDGPTRMQVHAAAEKIQRAVDVLQKAISALDDLTAEKFRQHEARISPPNGTVASSQRPDCMKACASALTVLRGVSANVMAEMKSRGETRGSLLDTNLSFIPDPTRTDWNPLREAMIALALGLHRITGKLPTIGWQQEPAEGPPGYRGTFVPFAKLLAEVVGEGKPFGDRVGKVAQEAVTGIRKHWDEQERQGAAHG